MAQPLASYIQQKLYRFIRFPSLLYTLLRDYAFRPSEPIPTLIGSSSACRYRLDSDTSAILELSDGRRLGYAQYGLDTGPTVFYLHGTPGSRIEAASLDKTAKRLGVRVISIDRPGIGWSSPVPNRTILDHARDVERLAMHLGLESYGVLGISGGGPYALACAVLLPAEKLKVVSIVCGLGPPDMGYVGMNWSNWFGFKMAHRYIPRFVQWWVGSEPASRLDLTDEERLQRLMQNVEKMKSTADPKDVVAYSDVDRMRLYLSSSREAFVQGFDGFTQDGAVIGMHFGFELEDIRPDVPVRLWYGKRDTYVPSSHGEQTAARLGSRAYLRMEDETHASLVARWDDEILEDLVRVLKL